MTPREQGFLLLTNFLGDPERNPLTAAQVRKLTAHMRSMPRPEQQRELLPEDLVGIGYDRPMAERIVRLLSHGEQLRWYVQKGEQQDCYPLTRVSKDYPAQLRLRLGDDRPSVLWCKGDPSLLQLPGIALVGSRDLRPENAAFAQELGKQAALQGYVLISGNARGADRVAQESCLEHGGQVISVVADKLTKCPLRRNTLFVSEDGFDLDFSAHRALRRNRIIHCLGQKTFVAQCTLRKGGTWDGTANNLLHQWSPVFCYDDGSSATAALVQIGAVPVSETQLHTISALQTQFMNFLDQ